MKLTLWQQFSSNHSASFFVVGQFESAEWAEMVASELRLILYEVGLWWENITADDSNDRYRIEAELRRQKRPTPPEEKYQQQYQVEWSRDANSRTIVPLDWVFSRKAIDDVRTFQNLVILCPTADSWIGPQPFDAILKKLGGKVAANCELFDHYVSVQLTCQAPDETSAGNIMQAVRQIRPEVKNYIQIAQLYPTRGQVFRDGLHIRVNNYQLLGEVYIPAMHVGGKNMPEIRRSFEDQLEGLLEFFRGNGCIEIEYHLTETDYDEVL